MTGIRVVFQIETKKKEPFVNDPSLKWSIKHKVSVYALTKVPNSKHQIPNKLQYPMTKTDLVPAGRVLLFGLLNLGHWNLFVIYDLLFGPFTKSSFV